ncbi:MAG: efflux RND transporter periplasmic adaptor subunit [Bacteroidia bacterium]|nr:efflux RND transporter periplasmic adaptor subunit [Bacteroidia bacterium]
MKKIYFISGAIILLLLLTFIFTGNFSGVKYEVNIEKATYRDIEEVVSASGKIQPETDLKITSDVSGEITELYVKEGMQVKKGELLCRIRPDIYLSAVERTEALVKGTEAGLYVVMAQLEQAKANLAAAKGNFERLKKLHEKELISDQEFENAKAQFESAQANFMAMEAQLKSNKFNVAGNEASLREAKNNLERTYIYAPVDGTIYKLNVEKGERVQGVQGFQGTEILRMANLNEMQVVVEVNENDILKIKRGDTARVEVDAHQGKIFKGVVTEVGTSANTGSLTTDQAANYLVKIRILKESYAHLIKENAPYPFLPGMSASVDIITKKVFKALSVPVQAVTARSAKNKPENEIKENSEQLNVEDIKDNKNNKKEEVVFLVKNGKAVKTRVQTGIQDMEYIEIISGLKENDEVIVSPYTLVSKILNGGEDVKVSKEIVSYQDQNE